MGAIRIFALQVVAPDIYRKDRKRSMRLSGLNIEEAHYSLIKEFNIFLQAEKRQTIANQFLYTNRMIDRVELDNAFAELAKSKGIRIKREYDYLGA